MRQSITVASSQCFLPLNESKKIKVFFDVTGQISDSEIGRGKQIKILTMSISTEPSTNVVEVLDLIKDKMDYIEICACDALNDSYSFDVDPSNSWSDFWEKAV